MRILRFHHSGMKRTLYCEDFGWADRSPPVILLLGWVVSYGTKWNKTTARILRAHITVRFSCNAAGPKELLAQCTVPICRRQNNFSCQHCPTSRSTTIHSIVLQSSVFTRPESEQGKGLLGHLIQTDLPQKIGRCVQFLQVGSRPVYLVGEQERPLLRLFKSSVRLVRHFHYTQPFFNPFRSFCRSIPVLSLQNTQRASEKRTWLDAWTWKMICPWKIGIFSKSLQEVFSSLSAIIGWHANSGFHQHSSSTLPHSSVPNCRPPLSSVSRDAPHLLSCSSDLPCGVG